MQANDGEVFDIGAIAVKKRKNRRHEVTLKKDVRKIVLVQELKVCFVEIVRISDFNRIGVTFWAFFYELGKLIQKALLRRHFIFVEIFELKHQRTKPVMHWRKRLDKLAKKIIGKKMRICDKRCAFISVIKMQFPIW